MLLWISVTVFGVIGGAIPSLWDKNSFMWPALLSTVGGIFGIWFWYKFLRFL